MPVKKSSINSQFRLYRSETNRVLGGVAGGIAEVFAIDPTVVRLIFVLLFVFGGSGFLLYLILWVVIPSESEGSTSQDTIRKGADEIRGKAHEFAGKMKSKNYQGRSWFGILIILFGLGFLFSNFGLNLNLDRFWPFILIILGFFLITKTK